MSSFHLKTFSLIRLYRSSVWWGFCSASVTAGLCPETRYFCPPSLISGSLKATLLRVLQMDLVIFVGYKSFLSFMLGYQVGQAFTERQTHMREVCEHRHRPMKAPLNLNCLVLLDSFQMFMFKYEKIKSKSTHSQKTHRLGSGFYFFLNVLSLSVCFMGESLLLASHSDAQKFSLLLVAAALFLHMIYILLYSTFLFKCVYAFY